MQRNTLKTGFASGKTQEILPVRPGTFLVKHLKHRIKNTYCNIIEWTVLRYLLAAPFHIENVNLQNHRLVRVYS